MRQTGQFSKHDEYVFKSSDLQDLNYICLSEENKQSLQEIKVKISNFFESDQIKDVSEISFHAGHEDNEKVIRHIESPDFMQNKKTKFKFSDPQAQNSKLGRKPRSQRNLISRESDNKIGADCSN